MRISDCSSDVCSSDLGIGLLLAARMGYLSIFEQERYKLLAESNRVSLQLIPPRRGWIVDRAGKPLALNRPDFQVQLIPEQVRDLEATLAELGGIRSEEHTSELQSLMRISYAVF